MSDNCVNSHLCAPPHADSTCQGSVLYTSRKIGRNGRGLDPVWLAIDPPVFDCTEKPRSGAPEFAIHRAPCSRRSSYTAQILHNKQTYMSNDYRRSVTKGRYCKECWVHNWQGRGVRAVSSLERRSSSVANANDGGGWRMIAIFQRRDSMGANLTGMIANTGQDKGCSRRFSHSGLATSGLQAQAGYFQPLIKRSCKLLQAGVDYYEPCRAWC